MATTAVQKLTQLGQAPFFFTSKHDHIATENPLCQEDTVYMNAR